MSDTKVALQEAVTGNLAAQNVTIYRAHNTIQAWSNARIGNLKARNTVEKGVCYNDGVFNEQVSIGSVTTMLTDSARYFWLTVAEGQRHNGRAGTGVRIDRGGATGNVISPRSQYVKIEWLEITNFSTATAIAGSIYHASGPSYSYETFNNLMIHNPTRTGSAFYLHSGDNERRDTLANNVIYSLNDGVYTYSGQHFIVNNTVYDCNRGIVFDSDATSTIKNNLVVGNTVNWFLQSDSKPDGGYNVYEPQSTFGNGTRTKFLLNQTANSCFTTTAYQTFIDTTRAAPDLRLKPGADAWDAGDSVGLSARWGRDIQDTGRAYARWDVGAFEGTGISLPDTNRRSIGTNAAVIYSTGTATVADAYTIDLSGATLPSNVGPGDMLVVNANSATASDRDTLYLTKRVSDTKVTVWPGAKFGYTGEDYLIRRAYTSLSSWETGRQGNLITRHAIEQGVATNDGALSAFTIDGATTDSARFMWLISAPYARHNGVTGNWARINRGGGNGYYVLLLDEYSIVEGMECLNAANHWTTTGIDIQRNGCIARGNLVHNNYGGYGIKMHDGDGSRNTVVANNIVYNCGDGIFVYMSVSGYRVLVYNNTVYRNSNGFNFNGTHLTHKDSVFNNISIGNTVNYSVVSYGDIVADYNAGELGKMPGEGTHNIALSP
ncbi:MAG: hypothetical protein JNL74_18350, partial [Fibrobacteres bacterium]|nr:hypothetical protein [Fibrobacterota bacterium]